MTTRLFLLSPAYCGGQRARLLLSQTGQFDLARRVRGTGGAPLGEVFSFLSGLYFRGKAAYAGTFARPPAGLPGVLVITPNRGLVPPATVVGIEDLLSFAEVDVDENDPRYHEPLLRDAARLAQHLSEDTEIVLLGSIATGKYASVLLGAFGERLHFPAEFVGRGDMSRGGLLLRCVDERRELEYIPMQGAVRRGARPAKLPKRR